MTRLGLGSYGVAWSIGVPGFEQPENPMSPLGLLMFAEQLGLKVVQYADNLPLTRLSIREQRELRAEAAERGIRIEVGTRGVQTEILLEYIRLAAYFESPILRVVVDTHDHHPSPDEIVTLIRSVLPALESADVVLAVENHDRFKVRELVSIVGAIGSEQVGICLDTVNSFGALEGPDVVLEALAPYVVNLHIKEFVVRRLPHNMGFKVTGAPAGQGMLDVPQLLQTLDHFGRNYNAIIETWLSPLQDMQATIECERDWVWQSTAYLRTLIKE